jgi:hypothetical protein
MRRRLGKRRQEPDSGPAFAQSAPTDRHNATGLTAVDL